MCKKVAKKTRQYKVLLERVGWDFVATFGEVKMRGPDQGLGPIPASKNEVLGPIPESKKSCCGTNPSDY